MKDSGQKDSFNKFWVCFIIGVCAITCLSELGREPLLSSKNRTLYQLIALIRNVILIKTCCFLLQTSLFDSFNLRMNQNQVLRGFIVIHTYQRVSQTRFSSSHSTYCELYSHFFLDLDFNVSLSRSLSVLPAEVPSDPDEPFFILSLIEIPVSSVTEGVNSASEHLSDFPVTDSSAHQPT